MKSTYSTTVTIANGASLSGASAVPEGGGNYALVGFSLDSAWDTNSVTFQVLRKGSETWRNHYNDVGEITFASCVASADYGVYLGDFLGIEAIKVRSGTAASAANQSGDTVVTLYFEEY